MTIQIKKVSYDDEDILERIFFYIFTVNIFTAKSFENVAFGFLKRIQHNSQQIAEVLKVTHFLCKESRYLIVFVTIIYALDLEK